MKKFLKIFAMLAIALVTFCSLVACRNSAEESDTEIIPVDLEKLGEYTELTPGTGGTAGDDKTYVTFGVWPQTIKYPNVVVDKTNSKQMGMFTYCYGSDGNWYCEAREDANEANYTYSDGITLVAQASAGSSKWFKVEPIKWRVVTTQYKDASASPTDKKLLVAESGLYAHVPYYDNSGDRTISGNTIYPNNYEHSRIRAWLNGLDFQLGDATNSDHKGKGFLQTAFTAEEQAKIAETVVDNSVTSTGYSINTYACDNTNDKVFLLSYSEITTNTYFANDNTCIRKPTDFALANYAWKSSNEAYGGWFFLRSPHFYDIYYAHYVNAYGDATLDRHYVGSYDVVVPALCID